MFKKKTRNKIIIYIVLLVIAVVYIFPIFWMISTSFKTNNIALKIPPEWIPVHPTLSNFINIFADSKFVTFYKNTVIVATAATFISVVFASLASYSFSRFRFKGSGLIQMLFLSTQMFPSVALLIAMYTLYRQLGLINTYTALIIACITIALPLSTWITKGFYDTVPISLDEAAKIDGCGRFRTLFTIIMPLIQPGIIAIAIYAFMVSWDDFLWSLTLVNKTDMRTLTAGIQMTYMGEYSYDWSKVMTASVSASLPLLIIFIFLQKYLISGLTAGAVKG